VNLLAIALIASDALGILTRAQRDTRAAQRGVQLAEADRGVREAVRWLAYVRQHGSREDVAHAEFLLDAWCQHRAGLERGHQQ
jgi:hypothetical protein